MKWASYRDAADRPRVALVDGEELRALPPGRTLTGLLWEGHLDEAAETAQYAPAEVVPLAGATLLAPVCDPPSIRDFMAFENHVVTSFTALGTTVSPVWYEQPVFYFTNPAATCGPHDDIPIAPGTEKWDFELEVAAVVGRAGADLHPEAAEEHIAGYLVYCDWSARDIQFTEMQVNLGPAKGKDTANSFGPFLVTPDELADARSGHGYDLAMTASVNGREYARGTWADLHWSFGQMLAYASRGTTLRPGDIIGSGTVGTGCILELSLVHGSDAYPWLRAGDEVRLEVERLGAITSRIVPGVDAVPLR